MNSNTYDLVIIGGGPAGVAAGVYASRKRLKTLLIAESFGGQSIVSEGIENWIGTIKIPGPELAKSLEDHLRAYAGEIVTIATGNRVNEISRSAQENTFITKTSDGASYTSKAVLVTTGSSRKKLTIPGAKEYEHKGITYCASCDGPLFADQDVVVIGGGNAAFEAASQLLAYCKSVTLINRTESYRADEITVKKVLAHPKMKTITNTELVSIQGSTFVESLTYKNTKTGETVTLPTTGIFVEIGSIPATDFTKDLVEKLPTGHIKIDPWTQKTSAPGIWAAGDCTNILYHQNNIAAGDGVRALEDIYVTLQAK
jgi:alkyl hydroperoxide reductase subunit F